MTITLEFLLFLQKCKTTAITDLAITDPACPALAPPPGKLPLDPNAPSLWNTSVGVLFTCCGLIAVAMAVRMFTRVYILKMLFTIEDGKT